MTDDFGKRLTEAMRLKGWKQADVARLLSITPSAVAQWFKDGTRPRRDRVVKIAEALGVDAEALYGEPIPQPIAGVMHLKPMPVAPETKRDLPVYAAAEGGGGIMLISQNAIEYTYRSETSRGAECFAVHVVGASMEPAFFQGEQVVVDPRRVPSAGDDCVFAAEERSGEWRASIKRLLRVAPDRWRVRQYNPPKDFDLLRSEWGKAFKIIEKRFR